MTILMSSLTHFEFVSILLRYIATLIPISMYYFIPTYEVLIQQY